MSLVKLIPKQYFHIYCEVVFLISTSDNLVLAYRNAGFSNVGFISLSMANLLVLIAFY